MNEPLLRFDYLRNREFAPAHINVHAESSALGMLFGRRGGQKLPKLQSLHLPVGGKRFRPSLEDVVEFLIEDFGVEPLAGWTDYVEAGRDQWYGYQLGASIRRDQERAAEIMRDLGWTVERSDP